MMLSWMSYLLLVSALLAAAGLAAEGVLRRWGLPARGVWMAALVGPFLVPLTEPLRSALVPAAVTGSGAAGEVAVLGGALGGVLSAPSAASPALDAALLALWLLGSAACALHLRRSQTTMRRIAAGAEARELDGERVGVTESAGPGVYGFRAPRIVIPRWALELPSTERRLLLEHEAEHLRGRDLSLLLVGLLVRVALPWNPATWWSLSRLRRAIEIDCDGRVLRTHRDPHAYGALLLKIVSRPSAASAAAAFSLHSNQLEGRVRAMTGSYRGNRWAVACLATMAAALLLLTSCRVDQPTSLAPSVDVPAAAASVVDVEAGPTTTPFTVRPELVDRRAFGMSLQERYPGDLRAEGIGGTVILWVLIRTDGSVGQVRLVESTGHPALDEAGMATMREATFTPARRDAEVVPVWIQIPVTFQPA